MHLSMQVAPSALDVFELLQLWGQLMHTSSHVYTLVHMHANETCAQLAGDLAHCSGQRTWTCAQTCYTYQARTRTGRGERGREE